MTFITGNKRIQELIKEKAVLLHDKLLRIPGDQYWKTNEKKPRNLKMQNGFIEKVTEIKTKLEINLLGPELFFFNFSTPVYKM